MSVLCKSMKKNDLIQASYEVFQLNQKKAKQDCTVLHIDGLTNFFSDM